jgi:TetR/AcrR family transcriptional regulator, transcriptional repressor for nem operon
MLTNMGIDRATRCCRRESLGPSGWCGSNRSMPGSSKRHERVREKVLEGASRLFNRHGFNAVSIDDVMAEAGLTRGSFYSYFSSKTDLYAEAVARIVDHKPSNGHGETYSPGQIIRAYLSDRHFETIESGCPIVGLPSDISRTSQPVRQAFESVLRLMIETFERGLPADSPRARDSAIAIASMCVGGMILARSIEDRTLSDEICEATMNVALSLGEWG